MEVNEVNILCDSIGSPLVEAKTFNFFPRREDKDTGTLNIETPALRLGNIGIELYRLVLGQDTDHVDTRVRTITQREIDDTVFTTESDSRFCDFFCQAFKTGSTSTGQNHRQ